MTSVWLDGVDPPVGDPLPGPDEVVDVAVVGAGLTGLATALLLARAGLTVACLEAREVGAVTTGRTTGKVSLLQGTHLSTLRRHHGREVAEAYVDANREGMEWLLRFCADHDVAVQRRDAVTFAAADDELSAAVSEHGRAGGLGLPVVWQDRLDVPFPHVGATVLPDQAQLDAVEVLHALVPELRRHGGTLHQGLRVESLAVDGTPSLRLSGGAVVHARQVVLATGTPVLDRGLHFARLEPLRSYALAVDGAGPLTGMYLSAGSDARSVRDAPGGRLVVGGSGHVVGRARSEREHLDALDAWCTAWFPGAARTHAWSAQDYGTPDGVPYVGRVPGTRGRVHVATGYAKWGMTNAVAAALTISADLLGEVPDWAAVLADRPRVAGAAQVARINLGVGAAVAQGAGRTLRAHLPGVGGPARARECGVVGVCTHLGGLLRWNDAEESWDCPLHGSRFTAEGEVLEGPATRPLRRRSGD